MASESQHPGFQAIRAIAFFTSPRICLPAHPAVAARAAQSASPLQTRLLVPAHFADSATVSMLVAAAAALAEAADAPEDSLDSLAHTPKDHQVKQELDRTSAYAGKLSAPHNA